MLIKYLTRYVAWSEALILSKCHMKKMKKPLNALQMILAYPRSKT